MMSCGVGRYSLSTLSSHYVTVAAQVGSPGKESPAAEPSPQAQQPLWARVWPGRIFPQPWGSPRVPMRQGCPLCATGAAPPSGRCVLRAWHQTWQELDLLRWFVSLQAIIFPLISQSGYLKIS